MLSGYMSSGLTNAALSSCLQAFPKVLLDKSRHQVLP